MITVNLNDVPAPMRHLFTQALQGEDVVFCRDNEPVLALKKTEEPPKGKRMLGNPPFPMEIPDDIGDPLPEEIWDMFNGRDDKYGR